MCIVVGLDVHVKSKSVYCIMDKETGEVIAKGKFESNYEGFKKALGKILKENPKTEVGLENGTGSYKWANIIQDSGGIARVYSADEVSSKSRSQRKKCDYRDAEDLCNNMRGGVLTKEIRLPPLKIKYLRSQLKLREMYVRQGVQVQNNTRCIVREYGIKEEFRSLNEERGWEILLSEKMPKVVKEMIEINHRQFIEIKKRLEELEKEISKYDRELKEFEILRSIPGFGDVSTRTMKALIFDINRFDSGKKLVSYLGLSPSSYDSGERVRHGRITKEGNKLGRKVLIEVAQKSSMKWHPLNRVYRRYVVKKGHNKAVVAIAAKMCRIMYRMLKNKEEFSVGKLLIKEPVTKKNAYLINNVSVKTEGKAVKEG